MNNEQLYKNVMHKYIGKFQLKAVLRAFNTDDSKCELDFIESLCEQDDCFEPKVPGEHLCESCRDNEIELTHERYLDQHYG